VRDFWVKRVGGGVKERKEEKKNSWRTLKQRRNRKGIIGIVG